MWNRDDITEIQKSVEKIQKDFIYTKLHDGHWICRKIDTSIYCFEIVIGKYQIYMGGDIDSLVFKVGENYGMRFLAGTDVNYYMHSKLDHVYLDQKEFDKNALDDWLLYIKECNDGDDKKLLELEDLKENLKFCDGLPEIYDVIYRSKFYDGEMPDIEKSKHSIIFSLYMVNHAAKKICEIINAENDIGRSEE